MGGARVEFRILCYLSRDEFHDYIHTYLPYLTEDRRLRRRCSRTSDRAGEGKKKRYSDSAPNVIISAPSTGFDESTKNPPAPDP